MGEAAVEPPRQRYEGGEVPGAKLNESMMMPATRPALVAVRMVCLWLEPNVTCDEIVD